MIAPGIAALFHLIAFALLLLGVISAPVTTALKLAQTGDFIYGVFGYCQSERCSSVAASYAPSDLGRATDWVMSSSVRDTLAKILIIVPVAAGLTLISTLTTFICALSQKCCRLLIFRLISLFFSGVAFLSSALITVIVFLIFYPHVTWGSWILIPAAALNVLSFALMCVTFHFGRAIPDENSDITSMEEFPNFRTNLLDETKSIDTSPNFAPHRKQESFSSSDKKSVNDVTTFYNRSDSTPNLVNGPNGSGVRSQAPEVVPEVAQAVSSQEGRYSPQSEYAEDVKSFEAPNKRYVPSELFDEMDADPSQLYGDDGDKSPAQLYGDDSGSDFTSISQRPINPAYRGQAHPYVSQVGSSPLVAPGSQMSHESQVSQGVPQGVPQSQNVGQFVPQSMSQSMPHIVTPQMPHMPPMPRNVPPHMQNMHLQYPQQYPPQNRQPRPRNNAADMVLSHNPDLNMPRSGRGYKRTVNPPGMPSPSQMQMGSMPRFAAPNNYKNRANRNKIPSASMSRDGPYGNFI